MLRDIENLAFMSLSYIQKNNTELSRKYTIVLHFEQWNYRGE